MYTVYQIINNINQKSYVGSSIQVIKRWKKHKDISQNPNHKYYNYPLYQAFRKYGIENFTFKILKDDFNSIEEMQQYEQEMIIYYDCLHQGYNQTLSTNQALIARENLQKHIQQISKKCAKVDNHNNIIEIYSSYHDAYRKNFAISTDQDIDAYVSHLREVCKGIRYNYKDLIFRDLDENDQVIIPKQIARPRCSPIYCYNLLTEEETYFSSVSEAAAAITNNDRHRISACAQGDIRYSIVHNCIFRYLDIDGNIQEPSNGPTIEDKIQDFNKKYPEINGERHSIAEWSQIYNINVATVRARLRTGDDIITALTKTVR